MRTICKKVSGVQAWNERVNALKDRQFTALTAEEILEMDCTECKLLMLYNMEFFELAMKALEPYVEQFLAETNEFIREDWDSEEDAPQFDSLDSLLKDSNYFGDTYESSRRECVNVFLDHLYDYVQL